MKRQNHTLKHQSLGTAAVRTTILCSAAILLVLALTGCASLPTDLVTTTAVDVERVNSTSARIRSVFVGDNDGILLVRGRLEKPYFGRGLIPGHLHIEVLGKDGLMLGQEITRYYRRSGKSCTSRFSRKFSVHPEDVRTVRIVHHFREDNEIDRGACLEPVSHRLAVGSIQPT